MRNPNYKERTKQKTDNRKYGGLLPKDGKEGRDRREEGDLKKNYDSSYTCNLSPRGVRSFYTANMLE